MTLLDDKIQNYNLVKEVVISRLVKEGYISNEEGIEFCTRMQVIVYKAKWFKRWFTKRHPEEKNLESEYFKMIELEDKETNLDDLIRRSAQKT